MLLGGFHPTMPTIQIDLAGVTEDDLARSLHVARKHGVAPAVVADAIVVYVRMRALPEYGRVALDQSYQLMFANGEDPFGIGAYCLAMEQALEAAFVTRRGGPPEALTA